MPGAIRPALLDTRLRGPPCSTRRATRRIRSHMEHDAGRQADTYFQAAYAAQMRGDLDEAITLYRKSLACVPTAEAYTFLGWTLSLWPHRKRRKTESLPWSCSSLISSATWER